MHDLVIIFLSALPVGELRVSLPFALQVYHFSAVRALFDVYLGNFLPIFPLLYGLRHLMLWLDTHSKFCHRVISKSFKRIETHLKGHYEKYGAIALFLWVAATVPPTGVWSAAIAAVLFGIRPKVAVPAIMGGLVIACLVVFAVTTGVVQGVHAL